MSVVTGADARPHPDLGLQPERTSLAWSRTLLSLMVAGAFQLRWVGAYGPVVVGLCVVLAAGALWIFQTQRRRYLRATKGLREEQGVANLYSVLVLTGIVLLVGVVAVVLVFVDAVR